MWWMGAEGWSKNGVCVHACVCVYMRGEREGGAGGDRLRRGWEGLAFPLFSVE